MTLTTWDVKARKMAREVKDAIAMGSNISMQQMARIRNHMDIFNRQSRKMWREVEKMENQMELNI